MREGTPRFVADEMLQRLGRWLRAAGYDVLMLPSGTGDRVLIEAARVGGRLLITRDRKLQELRGADCFVICLNANDTDGCARELAERIAIDWLLAPFSRCLCCNTALEPGDHECWSCVPAYSRSIIDAVWRCPGCERIFWRGSHVERMLSQLMHWHALNSPPLPI